MKITGKDIPVVRHKTLSPRIVSPLQFDPLLDLLSPLPGFPALRVDDEAAVYFVTVGHVDLFFSYSHSTQVVGNDVEMSASVASVPIVL